MFLRTLHLFLAFCIFASSVGVSVSEHVCSVNGRSASVFGFFDNSCCSGKTVCAPQKAKNLLGLEDLTGLKIKRAPCCQNKTKYTQNVLKTTKYEQKKPLKQKITLACAKYSIHFFAASSPITAVFNPKTLRFRLYKPPPRCRDIPVLIQSFLC